ncbi:hypothetical protein LOH54_07710 [Sulfurimonas sp. HSL-3221]|uniref:hypothetical protein n=1 Tax=Sulfurimonadaceae TaxID=2771471 RepID=UPI001E5F30D7|nr:hypothetical protein [Sulfurimonas sp. HSL-3221]UFS61547.1 hypothetical protein LOH54_07710 [Sulfurimonas sp. HSL-3221]
MDTKEETLKALSEGKELTSTVTGLKYKLIEGLLHSRNSERAQWQRSGLDFHNPVSWQNLQH